MTSYRWYKLRTNCSLQAIFEKMNSMPFNQNNSEGFKIDDFYQGKIFAQYLYVERFNNEENLLSVLKIVDFVLFKRKESVFIRIRNPSHGVKKLANVFLDICDFPFSFEQVKFSYSDCEDFIKYNSFNAKVTQVKINRLYLTNDIESEILLKSKEGIDLSKIDFLTKKDYQKVQVTWSIDIDNSTYTISVSESGLLSISEYLTFDILDYIESIYLLKFA